MWVFVAALAFGGLFIVLALLGSEHHLDASSPDLHALNDAGLFGLFSLRNLTWASFAFGGIGLLGVLTERPAPVVWTAAGAAAAIAWAVVHVVFRALRRSEGVDMPLDVAVIGASASLVVPFNEQGEGVVQCAANGQYVELPARRAAEYRNVPAPQFTTCRIESIESGFAIVTPLA